MLRLIRAIGAACQAQPLLNAHFDDEAMSLTVKRQVDLGIAMETEDGLYVPVLRDINQRDLQELQEDLHHLKQAVRARDIKPDALRGQTITLSNFGVFGGRYAEMVVVPPQVAIVGTGRAYQGLALVDGRPQARRLLPLSITFDHRVVTGAETGLFLQALIEDLERSD